MNLHELRPPERSKKRKKRVGRGIGSGHGKTSTRGHKGLKARSGGSLRPGFEGGQMPLIRRMPKRGFRPRSKTYFQLVNVGSLGKLDTGDPITPEKLKEAGLIKSTADRVKILGTGEVAKPLTVKAHAFSKTAAEKIKKAGGKAEKLSYEGRKTKDEGRKGLTSKAESK